MPLVMGDFMGEKSSFQIDVSEELQIINSHSIDARIIASKNKVCVRMCLIINCTLLFFNVRIHKNATGTAFAFNLSTGQI